MNGSNWISVTEAMPPPFRTVEVLFSDGETVEEWRVGVELLVAVMNGYITHWRPAAEGCGNNAG